MGWRGVVAMALALSGLMSGVQAQPWQPGAWRTDWWRNGSTLDMDFTNNRYMVSLTTPVTYTSLTQFITAVSGTFTRAGASETATGDPFYLAANQSFVSRATSTTQLTATGSPFYADASQAFYSRATSATYIDSSGAVQTAAANVARTNYIYNGSTWVSGGTLIEPARTNAIDNGYFTGAATGIIGTMSTVSGTGGGLPNKWGVSGWSPNNWGLNTQVVGLGTSNGLRYIDIRYYGTASGTNGSSWTGLYPGAPNQVAASSGQSWSGSVYLAVVSGSLTNIPSIALGISCRDVSASSIQSNQPIITDTSSLTSVLTRYSASLTCTNASTTYVALNAPSVKLQNGPIDVTFRLAGPQLELGASPTSYIATSGSTVTRAADVYTQQTASYFDSTGTLKFATAGAARADYHPSTLAYRGILAEPARTNLQYYSNDFSLWPNGSGVSVTQNVTGPDGNTSAWTLTQTDANGTDSRRQFNWGVVSDTSTYVFSIFVKKTASAPSTYPTIQLGAVGYIALSTVQINPYTGSIYKTGSGTAGIIDSGSYWRVWAAITNNNQSTIFAQLYPSWTATWGSARASVMGGSAVFYGAQLEQASVPSSYIPTYSVPASRAADVYTSGYSGTYFDSTGTLRNAPANTPRLDYDPSTSEPKGILIEEARTNLIKYPTLQSAYWTKGSAVTAAYDALTDPAGGTNASMISPAGTCGYNCWINSGVSPNFTSITSGTTYIYSIFVKPLTANAGFQLRGGKADSSDGAYATFTLAGVGSVSSTAALPSGTYVSSGIQYVGSGWYRPWIATQTAQTTTNGALTMVIYDGASYAVWGAQIEQGAFPTSYIPTSGSTVTRPAENFRISTTTGWYNPAGGTLGVEALSPGLHDAPATYNGVAALNGDGGAGTVNAMHMTFVQNTSASYPAVEVFTDPGGTSLVWQDTTFFNTNSAPYLVLFPPNLLTKWVLAYKNNDSRAAINGTLGPAGTTTQVPVSITMLRIGANRAGPSWNSTYNGVIRRVWYMPTRQPDESLPDYTR